MRIKPRHNQTFFDLAVCYAGSVEAAYDIAYTAGRSVTDTPPEEVEIPEVLNTAVTEYFIQQQVTPATSAADIDKNSHHEDLD